MSHQSTTLTDGVATSSPTLTTLSSVREELRIAADDTTLDSLINSLITRVENAIRRWIRYNPHRVAYAGTTAEFMDGSGHEFITVKKGLPLISVQNLYLDSGGYYGKLSGGFATASKLTEGRDFVPMLVDSLDDNTVCSKSGTIRRIGGYSAVLSYGSDFWPGHTSIWPIGQGNVKIEYTAGYATIPSDLEFGARKAVAWNVIRARQKAGATSAGEITSEHLGDYSVSYAATDTEGDDVFLGPEACEILKPYRQIRVV